MDIAGKRYKTAKKYEAKMHTQHTHTHTKKKKKKLTCSGLFSPLPLASEAKSFCRKKK
jgi:hypothetical protein